MSTLARKAAAAVVTVGALLAPAAQPAQAGVAGCTLAHVTIERIEPAALVNCTFDSVGNCIVLYDPLFPPFPNNVVPETTQLAFCIPL